MLESVHPSGHESLSLLSDFFSLTLLEIILPITLIVVAIRPLKLSEAVAFIHLPVSNVVGSIKPNTLALTMSVALSVLLAFIGSLINEQWDILISWDHLKLDSRGSQDSIGVWDQVGVSHCHLLLAILHLLLGVVVLLTWSHLLHLHVWCIHLLLLILHLWLLWSIWLLLILILLLLLLVLLILSIWHRLVLPIVRVLVLACQRLLGRNIVHRLVLGNYS